MNLTEADMYEIALGRTKKSRAKQLLAAIALGCCLILLGAFLYNHGRWASVSTGIGMIVVIMAFFREIAKQNACREEARKLYQQYLNLKGGQDAKKQT